MFDLSVSARIARELRIKGFALSLADAVLGQLWESRAGCGLSVRAGDETGGQRGKGRPLEALLSQGAVCALARLLFGPGQHRSHLQPGHQRDQVEQIRLREGGTGSSLSIFVLHALVP